ncbi:hypothetical protein ACROYT_G031556 [Oculina patagonica]
MAFLGENGIKFIQIIVATTSLLTVTRTGSGEVTYTEYDSNHRWSDAKNYCVQKGGFLAKIKNLDELKTAKGAFIQHHTTDFWVGVKYNPSIRNFVWADGTPVTSSQDFEAIVNRNEQETQGYTKRCMYMTDNDNLVPDECEAHRKYMCQVGETDDADAIATSSSSSMSSHVQLQASTKWESSKAISSTTTTSSPSTTTATAAAAAAATTTTSKTTKETTAAAAHNNNNIKNNNNSSRTTKQQKQQH